MNKKYSSSSSNKNTLDPTSNCYGEKVKSKSHSKSPFGEPEPSQHTKHE